jgi:hypothetical protein
LPGSGIDRANKSTPQFGLWNGSLPLSTHAGLLFYFQRHAQQLFVGGIMTIYKMNPSGDEISAAGHSSHASYHRARKKAQRLSDWENRNAENTVQVDSRPNGGLDASLDHAYPGSYLARALRAQQSEEAAQVEKPSLIPALSPEEFRTAKDAWEWYFYQYTLSDDRRKWIMKFGIALRLALPQETWQGLDDVRRSLIIRLIESEDAVKRFS